MNGRERIQAAFAHRAADRVPVDFGGHRSSGIMALAYVQLRRHLGLAPSPVYVYDFVQQLAIIEDDVLERLHSDVVQLGREYFQDESYWRDWMLPDGTPCKIPAHVPVQREGDDWVVRADNGRAIGVCKPSMVVVDQTYWPLLESDEETFERLPDYIGQVMWSRVGSPPAPAGFDAAGQAIRRRNALAVRESTDRAVYGIFGGNLLELGTFLFRNDNFLCELAANPRRVHTFLDRLVEYHLPRLESYVAAVGDYIDVIGFGDDLGMQTGPQISPAMYREFFKPRHALLWQRAKELNPRLKVCLHCCGGVYPLLPDLIDAGLDAINPVQFTCRDMDVARLKREFGRELVFWGGGCDTQGVLLQGTPDEVRRHVREQVSIMAPGGGFVFQQVHNILAGVPPANIVAMFDAING